MWTCVDKSRHNLQPVSRATLQFRWENWLVSDLLRTNTRTDPSDIIYIQCIYMVIDLKVLVKSWNCEDRSCYAGNPRKSFLWVRDFFLRKLDIMNRYHCIHDSLLRATSFCHPGVRQENGSARLLFPSYRRWGFATAKYHGLEAHPCTCRWYCLTLLSEVSRNKLQMQQPSFQKWGVARAKHQGPLVFAFPLMRPLLMARACGYAKGAKVKVHFEGSGPVSLAKKT